MNTMHPHTVDWLRNVEIAADSVLARKRWDVAAAFGSTVNRSTLVDLLRIFLFPNDSNVRGRLTEKLLHLDPDFPVSGNTELLRVMSGLVMATILASPSEVADALALGLRAARMANTRGNPAIEEIPPIAEQYLSDESSRQRPDSFSSDTEQKVARLNTAYDVLLKTETAGDAAQTLKARRAYHLAVADGDLTEKVQQIAEETQLLWWLVGQYSPALGVPTATLTTLAYAFVAASEVAARIRILPPPVSVDALVSRSLVPCKPHKNSTVSQYLAATNDVWRKRQVAATINADCRDLVPMCTGLEKMHELGASKPAVEVLAGLCPEVDVGKLQTGSEIARQYLSELIFLNALSRC